MFLSHVGRKSVKLLIYRYVSSAGFQKGLFDNSRRTEYCLRVEKFLARSWPYKSVNYYYGNIIIYTHTHICRYNTYLLVVAGKDFQVTYTNTVEMRTHRQKLIKRTTHIRYYYYYYYSERTCAAGNELKRLRTSAAVAVAALLAFGPWQYVQVQCRQLKKDLKV